MLLTFLRVTGIVPRTVYLKVPLVGVLHHRK